MHQSILVEGITFPSPSIALHSAKKLDPDGKKGEEKARQHTKKWLRDNIIPDLHTLQPDTADNPWKKPYLCLQHICSSPYPALFPQNQFLHSSQ